MGIKTLLSNSKYELVAEAENGEEACRLVKKHRPHYVILDVDMPVKDGIEAAKLISEEAAETAIVFLTGHADMTTFAQAWSIHASGFLFKENALEELLICLEQISKGETYVSTICNEFAQVNSNKLEDILQFQEKIRMLSKTELKILKLISEGMLSKEIANSLNNSYKTIENHRSNIVKKLDLPSGSNSLLSYASAHKELIKDQNANK